MTVYKILLIFKEDFQKEANFEVLNILLNPMTHFFAFRINCMSKISENSKKPVNFFEEKNCLANWSLVRESDSTVEKAESCKIFGDNFAKKNFNLAKNTFFAYSNFWKSPAYFFLLF